MHLYLLAFLSLAASMIYLAAGNYIYRLDPKAKVNKLFLFMCLALTIWALPASLQYLNQDESFYWQLDKISAVGWCFFHPVCLQMVLNLTGNQMVLNARWKTMLLYFPAFILLAWEMLLFGPGISPKQTMVIAYTLVDQFYYLSYSLISIMFIIVWKRKTTVIRKKRQADIILTTAILTLTLVIVTENYYPVLTVSGQTLEYSQIIILLLIFGMCHAVKNYGLLKLSSFIKAEDIISKVNDIIIVVDLSGTIVDVNVRVEELLGYRQNNIVGKPFADLIAGFSKKIHLGNGQKIEELYLQSKCSKPIPFNFCISSIYDAQNNLEGFVLVGQDMRLIRKLQEEIHQRRKKEAELEYIMMRDNLTSLFNRAYFERELQSLDTRKVCPVAIIVGDVDGLKLVNDAFGHDKGDELLRAAAKVMKKAAGEKNMVARIGGDEFVVMLTICNEEEIMRIEDDLQLAISEYNAEKSLFPLSISTGASISHEGSKSVVDLFKQADDRMYRVKLNRTKSVRNVMVQTVMRTMEARDLITSGHVNRLQDLAVFLGKKIGLSEYEITDLKLLAQFHDIGKVGIPDHILLKPGSLSTEERNIMQRHCEIGYRIAEPIQELMPISRLILLHHERYDGEGYPLGLSKAEIPMECRILAILDAYDAMTNDRPYRKAMSVDTALIELKKNAGTQFDPLLTAKFAEVIEDLYHETAI